VYYQAGYEAFKVKLLVYLNEVSQRAARVAPQLLLVVDAICAEAKPNKQSTIL